MENLLQIDAAAVVLAGGKSSRMGRPKALLPFDGAPLIAHVVRLLGELCAETVVVAAPGQELPSVAATLVRDEVAYQGPVSGIYHGLSAATKDLCFVTSCDAPFLSRRLIAHLLAQSAEYDVVVPHWERRYQPLHAVYRKTVAPLLKAQLARGELRPVFLFDKVRTRNVGEDEIRRLDPEGLSFLNMNTPEEYDAALIRWQNRLAPETVQVSVELFGAARLAAKTGAVMLALTEGATLGDVLAALGEAVPALAGRVVDRDGLVSGYTCNLNGLHFVRSPDTRVRSGDRILILSADAGG